MRFDLEGGSHRPWPVRMLLGVMRWWVGAVPGPVAFYTYRPAFIGSAQPYMAYAASGKGPWTSGQKELMATFVSNLNECHF